MFKKIFLVFTLVFAFTLTACSGGVEYPKTYGDVEVTAGEKKSEGVVMTLTTLGYAGQDSGKNTMIAEVTVKDGKIVAFVVKSHTESNGYGKNLIEKGELTQALITNTDSLSSFDVSEYLDAKASSTKTADALLDIAKAALKHYEEEYK